MTVTGEALGEANEELIASVLARLGERPFVDFLGCRLVAAGPGLARVSLPWRTEHCRSGVAQGAEPSLHGGAAATLADIAASCAVITTLKEGEGRTTIELSIHYLAPLRGDVEATATVRRRGGRTAVIDVEIVDRTGVTGAIARATFAIQPARRTDAAPGGAEP